MTGIAGLAKVHPRPFTARHPGGKYVAAALDGGEDLYLLLFAGVPTQAAADARVAAVRAALAGIAAKIRGARSHS